MERYDQKEYPEEDHKCSVQEQRERSLSVIPPKVTGQTSGIAVSMSGEDRKASRKRLVPDQN
jgi:hypothetical protein